MEYQSIEAAEELRRNYQVNISILKKDSPRKRILPQEFLSWAQLDIKDGDRRGIANALTNIKRALHARIDEILYALRIPYSKDWSPKSDTVLKLKVLKHLNVSITTIAKVLTELRNDLEHAYLLPGQDEVRAAVETSELWLEKSASYLYPTIGIANLPTTQFMIHYAKNTTVTMNFAEPKEVIYFCDDKKKIICLKTDGSTIETSYDSLEWRELIKSQKPFFPSQQVYSQQVPSTEATKIFIAYKKWVMERKECSFQLIISS